ncbi:hypothetical protein Agub_g2830, partial [Astrephomene gubernaculifera]
NMSAPYYHETQRRQMCLKHTLNNLLQSEAFTATDLDRMADGMTPPTLLGLRSPHRTPLFGNYDVNVLELALQQHGKVLTWFPRNALQQLAQHHPHQREAQQPQQLHSRHEQQQQKQTSAATGMQRSGRQHKNQHEKSDQQPQQQQRQQGQQHTNVAARADANPDTGVCVPTSCLP